MRWSCVWLCFLALSVGSVTDVQARLVRNHVSSICSTWGREHFKTFDGDVYQFPGTCEYNLASDCHETFQEFSVHMKRKEHDGNPTVSYVVVTINDLSFHLGKSLVTVNGIPVKLPYYNAGVQVERNVIYLKLQSKVGLVVMWNGDDAVMVEVDRDYANRTCGLCGDFNGVSVYNEFIHNDRKISSIEFGNKHKVHRPNDECEDPYEEEEESAEASLESCKEFQTTCDQILRSEPWSSCTNQINPEPYIQACVQDMCGCTNSTSDFCLCSTLSEFSRQCSHAGGQPPNWRTPQFCAKQCPFNMVYEESGSPCMDTCTHQDTSSLCEDHKMDGCFCPSGTVFDDISMRGCIAQSECQCKHNKIYNSGEVYRQNSEECTCFEGQWACKSLPTPATCAVEEGSHVTTFDGKTYTFHGECYYTLAKVESKDDASPKFTLLAQLAPCANQKFDTCLKALKIVLNNDRNNVLMFTSDGTVKQNMQTITLPYQSVDINIFHASSFHILLQTSFGLQIQIQHVPIMQVYVSLEQSYRAKTRGLCGNYNMVLSDDMKTPQGIVEGTAATFCNSWKANLMCGDRQERLDDPCSLSVENENYAKHWCALLLSPDSSFAQCRSAVDPEMYYKRCIYASCNCEKSEACLCAVFSSYARACASKGVFLTDWRENVCDKYTKSCPASQTFSYKHQRCQLTCRSLGSQQQSCISDFLPVDGCSCSDGLYLNENGICVPMAKCSCYHDEVYVKPGKSINIKDEHCVCTNGMLHCRSWRTRSSTCRSPKVFFNCSTAGTGEVGLQCARTCLNLDSDDCESTECESGCQCPAGLLDDGKGSCVKESDCPCQHDGHIYAVGRKIPNQCNTCACKSGKWECTEKKCPGTCVIYGSGHYSTFDKKTYGFQGHCAYVALKNKCGNKTVQENFGVITENVPCGTTGTTCSKTVRVQLGRKEVKLSKGTFEEVDLEEGSVIAYRVRRVGLYLVVESEIGLAVMWDRKTTIRILLEPQHSGEVCGLCGNFDGDGQNDFTTKGQMVVSSLLEFANSWKVSSNCPDVETIPDTCEARPNRHHWAKMMCSIITGETFRDCHKKVDPHPFYENCVKDSCACDSGGDCECFCSAVAAYAQACNEASVCVAWRTPEICPVFCDYYNGPEECKWHYSPCHTPCYKTCLNPQGICSNPIPNLEGCYPVCPEDKPIFDEETQMCVEACPITTVTPAVSTASTTTPPTTVPTSPISTPTTTTTSKPPTTAPTTPTTEYTTPPTTTGPTSPTTEYTTHPRTTVPTSPTTEYTPPPTTTGPTSPTTEYTTRPPTTVHTSPTTEYTTHPPTTVHTSPTTEYTTPPTTGPTSPSTPLTTEYTTTPTTVPTSPSTAETTPTTPTITTRSTPPTTVPTTPTTEYTTPPTTVPTSPISTPTTTTTSTPPTTAPTTPTTEYTTPPTTAGPTSPTTEYTTHPPTTVPTSPTTEYIPPQTTTGPTSQNTPPTTEYTTPPTTVPTSPSTAETTPTTPAITTRSTPPTTVPTTPTTEYTTPPTTVPTSPISTPTTTTTSTPPTTAPTKPTTEYTTPPTTTGPTSPTTEYTTHPPTTVHTSPTTEYTTPPTTGPTSPTTPPTTEYTTPPTTVPTSPSTAETTPTTPTITTRSTPPTTVRPTTIPVTSATTPCSKPCEWSEWYDEHDPATDKNDWETYENITNSGKHICANPILIECRSTLYPHLSFDEYLDQSQQVVSCNVSYGLICRKENQPIPPAKCLNCEFRVCCDVCINQPTTPSMTTEPPTTTTRSTPTTTTPTTPTTPPTTEYTTTPPTVPTSPTTAQTTPTTPTTTTRSTPPTTVPTAPTTPPTTEYTTTPPTVPTSPTTAQTTSTTPMTTTRSTPPTTVPTAPTTPPTTEYTTPPPTVPTSPTTAQTTPTTPTKTTRTTPPTTVSTTPTSPPTTEYTTPSPTVPTSPSTAKTTPTTPTTTTTSTPSTTAPTTPTTPPTTKYTTPPPTEPTSPTTAENTATTPTTTTRSTPPTTRPTSPTTEYTTRPPTTVHTSPTTEYTTPPTTVPTSPSTAETTPTTPTTTTTSTPSTTAPTTPTTPPTTKYTTPPPTEPTSPTTAENTATTPTTTTRSTPPTTRPTSPTTEYTTRPPTTVHTSPTTEYTTQPTTGPTSPSTAETTPTTPTTTTTSTPSTTAPTTPTTPPTTKYTTPPPTEPTSPTTAENTATTPTTTTRSTPPTTRPTSPTTEYTTRPPTTVHTSPTTESTTPPTTVPTSPSTAETTPTTPTTTTTSTPSTTAPTTPTTPPTTKYTTPPPTEPTSPTTAKNTATTPTTTTRSTPPTTRPTSPATEYTTRPPTTVHTSPTTEYTTPPTTGPTSPSTAETTPTTPTTTTTSTPPTTVPITPTTPPTTEYTTPPPTEPTSPTTAENTATTPTTTTRSTPPTTRPTSPTTEYTTPPTTGPTSPSTAETTSTTPTTTTTSTPPTTVPITPTTPPTTEYTTPPPTEPTSPTTAETTPTTPITTTRSTPPTTAPTTPTKQPTTEYTTQPPTVPTSPTTAETTPTTPTTTTTSTPPTTVPTTPTTPPTTKYTTQPPTVPTSPTTAQTTPTTPTTTTRSTPPTTAPTTPTTPPTTKYTTPPPTEPTSPTTAENTATTPTTTTRSTPPTTRPTSPTTEYTTRPPTTVHTSPTTEYTTPPTTGPTSPSTAETTPTTPSITTRSTPPTAAPTTPTTPPTTEYTTPPPTEPTSPTTAETTPTTPITTTRSTPPTTAPTTPTKQPTTEYTTPPPTVPTSPTTAQTTPTTPTTTTRSTPPPTVPTTPTTPPTTEYTTPPPTVPTSPTTAQITPTTPTTTTSSTPPTTVPTTSTTPPTTEYTTPPPTVPTSPTTAQTTPTTPTTTFTPPTTVLTTPTTPPTSRPSTEPTTATTTTPPITLVTGPTATHPSTAPVVPESTTITSKAPPSTVPPITPPKPDCPEWNVGTNETFLLCNCTMARCIENNTVEIIPYECPPIQNITCANGKKPVILYDEYHCCNYSACDCECKGWGDPHYITFDGSYYSYQGNCTYILMEEISPRKHLTIYIDNVLCDPTEDVSCPRSIIISYDSQVITLMNHNLIGAVQLEALKDGVRLKLPYSQGDVEVLNSGLNLIFEIPRLNVIITFGINGFSVSLPFEHFGNNTQGHCGTCNNNQADDCMLPGGQLVESCAVMADYWPAKHINPPDCKIPTLLPTSAPEPPPTVTPCKPDSICDMLKSSVFEECHPFVSPDRFFQGCVFDSCHVSNAEVECTSLQTYAAACAQEGICLHWRNHTKLCTSDCPSDKVYKPCGPAEQPTCDDNFDKPPSKFTTEGCFCPDGMKLFNQESGICVDKCGCIDPEGIPREFNERFEYNCQDCICEESTKTVTCKPKVCPAPPQTNCTGPGFVLVSQTNPSDPCCSVFVCQCHSNTCPETNMNCPIGYKPVFSVPEGGCCPEHRCDPKRVCVHKDIEYQPGMSVPAAVCQDCTCSFEVDPKSGLFKITCRLHQCKSCDLGYEYVQTHSDECCGKCVQTHCMVNVNGTKQLVALGKTWSPLGSNCELYSCVKSGETLTTISSHIVCPPFQESNCKTETIQTAANGCCKTCVEKEKACKLVTMKTHITHKSCQSYQEVQMPYCEGSCNTFTKYSEAAASMQHSCSCCKETRFSNRTIDLHCLNGEVVPYTYIHVEECGCGHTECTRAVGQSARRRRSFTLA
ncbi:mucin-2 isoform X2 [Sparus aurata]|uniref:mucin-2 isoform X2 n=1 Tax=Sparus aurata TaxID=8175 RepID=UPI0011C0CDD6|nr:mucin-2-like isoform X2 [Sparus aurata]